MVIKGQGCFCRRIVGETEVGELMVDLRYHPKAGRQVRSEINDGAKEMSHPLSNGNSVHVCVKESLKPFRRMFHQAERRLLAQGLREAVVTGECQQDFVSHHRRMRFGRATDAGQPLVIVVGPKLETGKKWYEKEIREPSRFKVPALNLSSRAFHQTFHPGCR